MHEQDSATGILETCNPKDPGELRRMAATLGYVYCPGLLSADSVESLSQQALQVVCDAGWGALNAGRCISTATPVDPDFTELQPLIQNTRAFSALRRDPALVETLSVLLGARPQHGWGDVFRVGVPNARHWTTPAHQDRSYLSCPEPVWTAWVPLLDCPRKLGPLAVLQGSHKQGLRAHRSTGPRGQSLGSIQGDWRSADYRVGDVCFFVDLCIHRALPNCTQDELRLSVDFRYSSVAISSG